MKATYRDCLLLGILLALFCGRLWGIGLTHTDDAVWSLRAWDTPGSIFEGEPVGEWARRQGRIWAFVSGAMMLVTIKWNGTLWGELLRFGGFAGFFLMFHLAVRATCGTRIALLAATLNIALAMVRWDGSIVTTYPLITWVAGMALCAGVIAGKRYVEGASAAWLLAAMLLLFFSLMNNEGVTAAFFIVALLAALGTTHTAPATAPMFAAAPVMQSRPRAIHFVMAVFAAGLAYAALYLWWRHAHPSQYQGHELAFRARAFLVTLWHFSTGGSVLHDLVWPYKVAFAEPQAGVTHEEVYGIWARGADALRSPVAWMVGGIAGLLMLRAARTERAALGASVRAMVAGLVIAVVAIAPVAATAMYQGWVMEKGVRAYSHTAFAHFGWSLVLAGVIAWVLGEAGRRRMAALAAAIVVAVLASLASAVNDDIANDMRPEAGRWRVLRDMLDANAAGPRERTLLVPRYANGSWYVWVPYGFWWQYADARWGEDKTRIYTQVPADVASAGWAMVGDYAWEGPARGFTGLMARLHPPGSTPPAAKAVVWSESRSLEGLVLAYPEGAKIVRKPVGGGVRSGQVTTTAIDVPDADWVRLEREGDTLPHPLMELDLRTGKVRNWTWPSSAVKH